MSRRRILAVVGTRAEAVKMAPVILALQRESWAECRVLATAQHRELLDQILGFFTIEPDSDLDLMRSDQGLADLTARLLSAIDAVLAEERPDLVIAQGDTTTVMTAALAAFYRGIRFAHVEAGLRTGDLLRPFPEEANRAIVARLAALHFAPTDRARANLLSEGVPAAKVHTVGNTVIDALLWTAARVDPAKFAPPVGKRLVLVTAHRRESFGEPFERICRGLRTIADRSDVELLFPVHPNPNIDAVARRELADHPHIRLVAPLDYPDMVAAMQAATLVLTDSGGIQEEAPTLGLPVLVLRDETERPEGVAAGVARLVGTDPGTMAREAASLLDNAAAHRAMATASSGPAVESSGAGPAGLRLYGDGHSAERIVELLHSDLAGRSG